MSTGQVCIFVTILQLSAVYVGHADDMRDSCDGYWYDCVYTGKTPGLIEFKIIDGSNFSGVSSLESLDSREHWQLFRMSDDDVDVEVNKGVVTAFFNYDHGHNRNYREKSLFGLKFYRPIIMGEKAEESEKRDRSWRIENFKETLTWYPYPEYDVVKMIVVQEEKELDIKIKRLTEEANDKNVKVKAELEAEEKLVIEKKEEFERKEADRELLKEEIANKAAQHVTLKQKATHHENQCAGVADQSNLITEEIEMVDVELGKKKEEIVRSDKRRNERVVEQEKLKKEKMDRKKKAKEEALARSEKRKNQKEMDKEKKEEMRWRRKYGTKNQKRGNPNSFQINFAKLLRSEFGSKTPIYQAYHGFFGKDLAKKRGFVYDIHQWIAKVFRKLVGMERVGLDMNTKQ